MSKINLNEFEGHTPGHWAITARNGTWVVHTQGNGDVATMNDYEDAKLVRAAPDLLAELIEACERIERLENALNALAQTAGDDPFFNKGGEGYEALFGVKSD